MLLFLRVSFLLVTLLVLLICNNWVETAAAFRSITTSAVHAPVHTSQHQFLPARSKPSVSRRLFLLHRSNNRCGGPVVVQLRGGTAAENLQHKSRQSSPRFLRRVTPLFFNSGDSVTISHPSSSPKTPRATAVYALLLVNIGVFLVDKVFRKSFVTTQLYLFHYRWQWWQLLTSSFCHADRSHLSNNLFLLLLFGRSVEDDLGWGGLLLGYVFCGALSSLVSLLLLPKTTVSIGASGAVFGLFAISTLTKLSWRELLDWRKLVEVAILGEFVFRQLLSEISTAASGGTAGINHVAHLSGAAAGAMLVFGMRATVSKFERSEKERRQ